MSQWVYSFGGGKAEGASGMRDLLGGKGANLAEMANLGLPVPPGFTITTEVCTFFYDHGKSYPPDLAAAVEAALVEVGRLTGRSFGDEQNPLLVSVRSGARASMRGCAGKNRLINPFHIGRDQTRKPVERGVFGFFFERDHKAQDRTPLPPRPQPWDCPSA